jgi:EAL domain-containing protein (putative c-di-GMP-specific phosphodiesterase class I)
MDSVQEPDIGRRLRLALERNQFRLHYQPQVERRTGRIVGAEALLRWHDPDAGLLAPGHFLPVLESTGLIVPVGEWVLQQAAEDGQRWQRLGFPRMRIAVNLTLAQLDHHNAEGRAFDTRALRACCDLQFEVPANDIVCASAGVIRMLQTARHDGVDIAMQGFDADEAVCAHLWTFPVDALKIGRAFIGRMTRDADAERVVSGIVVLARAFRLGLVAEGVERLDQVDLLAGMGCEQVQGWVYSPAVSAARFEKLLAGAVCEPHESGQRLVS